MARATAHPDHQCISSEDVQGTTVYRADGRNIGEIDHLIIDKLSGRVAYAVMSFGGFLPSRPGRKLTLSHPVGRADV
jgi:PRC-barrel domain